MKPDIYIKIRFRTSLEGGRKTSLKRRSNSFENFYSCPLIIDDKAYDCRLLIGDRELKLGKHYEVPVIFLNKELALPNLFVGKKITLWEGKIVADGQVTQICK